MNITLPAQYPLLIPMTIAAACMSYASAGEKNTSSAPAAQDATLVTLSHSCPIAYALVHYDQDANGQLSAEELVASGKDKTAAQLAKNLKLPKMTAKNAKEIKCKSMDANKDGDICIGEYKKSLY